MLKVVIVLGGSSPERFVSFDSGIAVGKALTELKYDVVYVDPATKNGVLSETDLSDVKNIDYYSETDPEHVHCLVQHMYMIKETIDPDLVFIALHGGYGEDGFIQDIMDRIHIKYTGSGAISSKIAMNKFYAKQVMQQNGVSVLPSRCVRSLNESLNDIKGTIGFPAIVKPNHGGSSVALTVVEEEKMLKSAVKKAFEVDSEVLIEPYIVGREITVTILDGNAYPIIEIKPTHELYDYECKYTSGMSEYIVPAHISKPLTETIQSHALKAYQGLGLDVYARIDFLLKEDGTFYCLEANTLPGMTSTSLVPKSVKAEGMSFNQLIQTLITLSTN